MSTYFHRTNQGSVILRQGFRDASGTYGMASTFLTGVWISNQPLDVNEGATGEQLLAIELNFDISCYEVVGDKSTYREWCVPADLLNGAGVNVQLMS